MTARNKERTLCIIGVLESRTGMICDNQNMKQVHKYLPRL
jgi:hypothetical protein